VIQMNSFGKMVESTRYLSPDGRCVEPSINELP
jgi:hypothetical protein